MTTPDAVPQPPSHESSLVNRLSVSSPLATMGQVANEHAARNAVTDYLSRKADNTIRRQAADLQRFADFLDAIGTGSGLELGVALAAFSRAVAALPDGLPPDPEAWRGHLGFGRGLPQLDSRRGVVELGDATTLRRGERDCQ